MRPTTPPPEEERRHGQRRAMPREIRVLLEDLRSVSRRSGAQTADGTHWRTIPKATVDSVIDALSRVWRTEEPVRLQ